MNGFYRDGLNGFGIIICNAWSGIIRSDNIILAHVSVKGFQWNAYIQYLCAHTLMYVILPSCYRVTERFRASYELNRITPATGQQGIPC